MRVQFLSDGSEYRSYGGGNFSKKTTGNGELFWWTIGITLLVAAATVSWFFSILVFAHPEKSFNYNLLHKFNKLEGIRKYTPLTVPHGQFVSGTKLLEEYFYFTPEQFRVQNDALKRHYIRNFKDKNPTYVKGNFEVLATRKLGRSDVFTAGWIVVGRDSELEDVEIELVLPGLATSAAPYEVGSTIQLDTQSNKTTYASLVHLQRMDGQRFRATLVPLVYQCATGVDGKTVASFAPPERLNLEAVWPISRDLKIAAAPAPQAAASDFAAQTNP